jgi:hypothetical protein
MFSYPLTHPPSPSSFHPTHPLMDPGGKTYCASFNSDGTRVLSVAMITVARRQWISLVTWDSNSRAQLSAVRLCPATDEDWDVVTCACFSPDGTRSLIGFSGGALLLFEGQA